MSYYPLSHHQISQMKNISQQYEAEITNFDCKKEIKSICNTMVSILRTKLKRRGVVVAVSGGIDSSVSAALAVEAFGTGKVFFLQLPEHDSAEETQSQGSRLIEHLKVHQHTTHNISQTLEAIGCYTARDEAIRETFPGYGDGWKNKIVIKGGLKGQINHFVLVVQDPQEVTHKKRLGLKNYLQIVAATNYKQRIRKTIEYYHADRLHYAVVGTPNRLEYDQGFFVKNGDGAADVKPIAHLYKTQVYALAKHLGLPKSICDAKPTTDTYSLPQGQDEFYFSLPYQEMDKALWAHNTGYAPHDLAEMLNCSEKKAQLIFQDIENKRKATQYLHARPYLVDLIPELDL